MNDSKSNPKVVEMFPANDFKVVADNAKEEIKYGIIIGCDDNDELVVFGGGMINKKQPTIKDWLWLIDLFKHKLLSGDFGIFEEEE